MGKITDIYNAINNLPDNLITEEIWQAGMEEGNLKILNILPEKYMIDENINKIIQKGEAKNCWYGFKLHKIPEIARTQKICDLAVSKDKENFKDVPNEKKSKNMLKDFLIMAENHIHFLPFFPSELWDCNLAYSGISSIYRNNSSNSNDNLDALRMIQVLLHYVPAEIKTGEFFIGLFNTSMKVIDINFLTPDKFKNDRYYIEMSKKEVNAVPLDKINYTLLCEAMQSDKNSESDFWGDWKNETPPIRQLMLGLIDNKMVNIILKRWPSRLSNLPEKYQTKKRLLTALASCKERNHAASVYSSFDVTRFDADICKAIVKAQEYDCPKFAPEIWTPDFIDFCMENAKNYYWFDAMPKELQTQAIVNVVIKRGIHVISRIRPDLISYDIAVQAYLEKEWNGTSKYGNYIPSHYLNDFTMETGLPKEFFGGETNYSGLKENHKNYSYFVARDCYVGFYADKDYGNTYNRVIMTRRTPMQIKPSIVLNRTVSTFHKTWLEKIISDNDPQFAKPQVEKGVKGKQVNLYMGVRFIETYSNVKIYAHTFLGETVMYTAGYMERNTLGEIRTAITESQEKEVGVAC